MLEILRYGKFIPWCRINNHLKVDDVFRLSELPNELRKCTFIEESGHGNYYNKSEVITRSEFEKIWKD